MMSVERLQPAIDPRRSDERLPLGRMGTVRSDAGHDEAVIVDLNRDGCRIATRASLLPDARVLIGIAHLGRLPARVVWHAADGYGCVFDSPLPSGAVTAAFGGSNLAQLSFPTAEVVAPLRRKLSPRLRLTALAASTIASWALVGAVVWAAVRGLT